MSVTRDYNINNIESKDSFTPEAQVSSPSGSGSSGGNSLLGGSISRTSMTFGRTATVKAGEDIRPALESLRSAGGGTLLLLAGVHRVGYDIRGDSKINVVGEGIDQTIIDFGGGNYALKYDGLTGSPKENFILSDFTIKNSGITHYGIGTTFVGSINLNFCNNFQVKNVRCTASTTARGFRAESCKFFSVQNSRFDNNFQDGLELTGPNAGYNVVPDLESFLIQNCIAEANGGDGFQTAWLNVKKGSFIACHAFDNAFNGFFLNVAEAVVLIGCTAEGNTWHGISCNSGSAQVIACFAELNTKSGFWNAMGSSTIVGCMGAGNTEVNFFTNPIDAPGNAGIHRIAIGNILDRAASTSEVATATFMNSNTQSIGNTSNVLTNDQNIKYVWNTSGGSVAQGSVVVYKATATGYEVTTTTVVGDDKVLGVVLATLANNITGPVLLTGKTNLLKVNGIADIAIGDFLGTYSAAGIAAKAAAGDMAFAIALEAYTTDDSNGVIDALLITPRKI